MRRRIHTIILYVLILVVSLPGLLYIYYEAARLHLHFTMEEAMERTHLQVLQIKSDELHWVRDGKEILVGDRMFDVHTFSQSGNSVIITGLFDDQETKIKEQLSFLKTRLIRKVALNKRLFNSGVIYTGYVMPIKYTLSHSPQFINLAIGY